MPTFDELKSSLRLPVIGAPMFLVSQPNLVVAQCRAGIVGAFPALNARTSETLDEWLTEIRGRLEASGENRAATPAPYAVNLIVHPSNERLGDDIEVLARHQPPMLITSVGNPTAALERLKPLGAVVLHDVTTARHARKAIEAGVDGLILVANGAGGHAGAINPFALVEEIRAFWDGPLILSGCIGSGRAIRAVEILGADLAYMGTRFIATQEANADEAYKQMILDSGASDIVYTPQFSGVPGSYLELSVQAAGLERKDLLLPGQDAGSSYGAGNRRKRKKAWRDIWSAGQGVGTIIDVPTVADLVERLETGYKTVA